MNKSQETIYRLQSYDEGDTKAERLAAMIVLLRGYVGIDPSHPRGGPDGVKDIICYKDNLKYVCGVYFSKKKSLSAIKKKFEGDIKGVKSNDADAFVFVTNLELTLSERDTLKSEYDFEIDIIHLESLATHLNSPQGYPTRLDHLGIPMEKEEQVAFFNSVQSHQIKLIEEYRKALENKSEQNSTVDKNKPVYPFYLKRESSLPFTGSISPSSFTEQEIYKKCSSCGYGYSYIDLHSNSGFITGSMYLTNQSTFNTFDSHKSQKVVECPNCGNKDQIN